jgi:hypothetical protein
MSGLDRIIMNWTLTNVLRSANAIHVSFDSRSHFFNVRIVMENTKNDSHASNEPQLERQHERESDVSEEITAAGQSSFAGPLSDTLAGRVLKSRSPLEPSRVMPETYVAELAEAVKVLARRLEDYDDQECGEYLEFLGDQDVLAEAMRNKEEMSQVWEEIGSDKAPEWLKEYGLSVRAANRLRMFVFGLRTIGGTSIFDVQKMIKEWPQLNADVQFALAWMANRCAKGHSELEELRSSVNAHHHALR